MSDPTPTDIHALGTKLYEPPRHEASPYGWGRPSVFEESCRPSCRWRIRAEALEAQLAEVRQQNRKLIELYVEPRDAEMRRIALALKKAFWMPGRTFGWVKESGAWRQRWTERTD